MTDPTKARADACVEAGIKAGDLTGVELLALFERKCVELQGEARRRIPDQSTDAPVDEDATRKAEQTAGRVGRAAALAITYGQEARQRYTEALAHLKGTHNPVDIEALDRDGVTADQERLRFEQENVKSEE